MSGVEAARPHPCCRLRRPGCASPRGRAGDLRHPGQGHALDGFRRRVGAVLAAVRAARGDRRGVELHLPAAGAGRRRPDGLLGHAHHPARRHAARALRPRDGDRPRQPDVRRRLAVDGLRAAGHRRERAERRQPDHAVERDQRAVPPRRPDLPADARDARRSALAARAERAVHGARRRRLVAPGRQGVGHRQRVLLLGRGVVETGRIHRKPRHAQPVSQPDRAVHGDRDPDQPARGHARLPHDARLRRPGAGAAARVFQPVKSKDVIAAEKAVVGSRFGSYGAYRAALARAHATRAVARGVIGDELRRAKLEARMSVSAPAGDSVLDYYQTYAETDARLVETKTAVSWLGGRRRGFALASNAPAQLYRLPTRHWVPIRTMLGPVPVLALGPAAPLGGIPLPLARPAVVNALHALARDHRYESWLLAQERGFERVTLCRKDDQPTPGVVPLTDYLPFLAAD